MCALPSFTFVAPDGDDGHRTIPSTAESPPLVEESRKRRRRPRFGTLEFGKYNRLPLEDAPIDYVVWLAGFRWDDEVHRFVECDEARHRLYYKSDDAFASFVRVRQGKPSSAFWSDARIWVYLNHPDAFLRAREFLARRCFYCGTALRDFRVTSDWDDRHLHKKCYLELKRIDFS
jgi:hypothetical protein